MNIPTCEGENPRINTGSCPIINDPTTHHTNLNHNSKDIKDTIAKKEPHSIINDEIIEHANLNSKTEDIKADIAETEADIVSGDGIKVYNQNVVLCDQVQRKDSLRKINDVTPELLSLGEGSGTIVAIIPKRDKDTQYQPIKHNTILYTDTNKV